MATPQDVLRLAAAEIGTTEFPAGSNRQKYSAELGRPAEPWCADFVVWIMRKAGITLPSESAYTPAMFAGFGTDRHYGTAGIAPGDVVFFDFPDSKRGIQHVGLVTGVNVDGSLITIEGNTSSGDSGSQDNGGGVFRRFRPARYVVGYGRPAYAKEIRPMFDPPLPVCATLKAPNGGVWGLGPDGGVYGFEGAPFYGSAAGQPYFSGRRAALLEAHPSGGYVIIATSGERYAYPAS